MAATTTTLKVDGGSTVGDTFQATATVVGTSPTGNVVLKDGTITLSVAALAGGVATFTVANLTPGSHPLWASYSGGGQNDPSVSPTMLHTVRRASSAGTDMTRRIPTVVTHEQTVAATVWTITHNFGGYPTIDVYVMYNGQLNKIIPSGITYVDANTVQVNFTTAYAGYATAV